MRFPGDGRFYWSCAALCVGIAMSGCSGGVGNNSTVPRLGSVSSQAGNVLREDWSQIALGVPWIDSSVDGAWLARYNGYGMTSIVAPGGARSLELAPVAAAAPSQTHAGLVTTVQSFGDLDANIQMQTIAQLRTPFPNSWEVAWLLWHYQDDTHFYYLILKPNGWELGKEDPAYPDAQRFLASGTDAKFPIGVMNDVRIVQRGTSISIWANGTQLTTFTDLERPYSSGSLGLYCEDARVHFGAITVN